MLEEFDPIRYAVIDEKNKREIVLLRGRGCSWRRCRFCDYHLDFSGNDEANYNINRDPLSKVTGVHGKLEVINSGSFVDLDERTMLEIETVVSAKGISALHFECHWNHRQEVRPLKERFARLGVTVKVKTGVETFDKPFRESYLDKGITVSDPREIAEYFDECCLLLGIPGQTTASMLLDIQTGLKHFERVCINIMQNNTKKIKADENVINLFKQHIYPLYADEQRVDILMENTEFGVGGTKENA